MSLLTHWAAPASLAGLGAVIALLFDVWDARRAAAVSVIAGAVAAAASAVLAASYVASGPASAVALSPGLGIVAAVLALVGAAAAAGGWRHLTGDERGGRMAVLFGLSVAGALLALGSKDLVALFAALEIMALSAYGLVALAGTDDSREASMKYFVQGAVATGLTLVAVAILFISGGGRLEYGSVIAGSDGFPRAALVMAWALLTVGLAFKAGAFPFHSWAPDAYQTADSPAAGLLASVSKGAAITVVAVVVGSRIGASGPGDLSASSVVAALSAGSIVFGNLAALKQTSFKRMLAYSGIAQVGYALIGAVSGNGWAAALLAMVYAPAALGAFLVAAAMESDRPDWDGTIAGMGGLAARRPALAAALAAIMLSLTGIPLLAGFWGKLAVFAAAAAGGWLWLAIVGAVGSVVSFGYYGAVLRAVYMPEPGAGATAAAGGERGEPASAVAIVLAALVVAAGVAPLVFGTGIIGIVLRG